jgi:hypothetical protein
MGDKEERLKEDQKAVSQVGKAFVDSAVNRD